MTEESQERKALRQAVEALKDLYQQYKDQRDAEGYMHQEPMRYVEVQTAITAAEKALGEKHDG